MTAAIVPLLATDTLDYIRHELERDPRLTSPHSRRNYYHDLASFEAWRNGRPMTKLLVEEYAAHLQANGRAASGVNRTLAAIRWWARKAGDLAYEDPRLDYAQREEIVTQAARVAGIADVKGKQAAPAGRHVTPGEIDALMRACANDHSAAGARDAAAIAMARALGLRRAELASLQLTDCVIDKITGEGRITIQGKGGKARTSYLTNGALDALRDWLAIRGDAAGPIFYAIRKGGHVWYGQGLTTESLAQLLDKRTQEAGITPRLTWHDLRRTFAGDLLENGVDVATVQKLMGHASPMTTTRYDRRPEDVRRRALRGLHVPYYGRRLA